MHRVRVISYAIKTDSYGYPRTTQTIKPAYEGRLLAVVGLAERVVYVIADDENNIKEESQSAWVKIQVLD